MAAWTWDDRFEPVPERLREVLDLVLPDFQRPRAIDVRFGYESDTGVLWASEPDDPSRSGFDFGHREASERSYLIVELADWLQDQFFPETAAAWGEARPACPGHGHPASARDDGDEAMWICPADGHLVAAIGRYGG